jgi:hypothetical protein
MQAPPTRPPYLFFSPQCPHCQQLIEMIKRNQSLAKKIEPINIHTARSLPPQLDGVPAILFANQLLVGPDTFKWVQFQTPQQNNDRQQQQQQQQQQNGMPGRQGQNQGQNQEEPGMPMPSDISSATKHGIDFTPLPGQEFNKIDPGIPRFSYLPGEGNQSDGTVGIDYVTAMDPELSTKSKGAGVAQQLERLQQMRGMDSDRMREQADGNMMYMQERQPPTGGGPGFNGPMGGPMGGMSSQMQGGYAPQGQMQGGYAPQGQMQGGYAPQGQMQGGYAPQGQMQGQSNYELQTGQRGGYSTQYQQQHGNQYSNEQGLPTRW